MVDLNKTPTKKELRIELQEVGNLFRLPGEIKKITLLKDGSLAVSYCVEYDTKKKYLFQILQ